MVTAGLTYLWCRPADRGLPWSGCSSPWGWCRGGTPSPDRNPAGNEVWGIEEEGRLGLAFISCKLASIPDQYFVVDSPQKEAATTLKWSTLWLLWDLFIKLTNSCSSIHITHTSFYHFKICKNCKQPKLSEQKDHLSVKKGCNVKCGLPKGSRIFGWSTLNICIFRRSQQGAS